SFVALPYETFPIFRNLGKLHFADVTAASGIGRASAPMGGYSPNLADFDNDGWKDLFVSRGHVQSLGFSSQGQVEQPNSVFRNLGGDKFPPAPRRGGFRHSASSPTPRLGRRRPEGRWPPRRRRPRPQCARRDLDQRQSRRQSLDRL